MEIIPLPAEAQSLLPRLGVRRDDVIRVQAMAGGLSGGRLYRLWLRRPNSGREQTLVLKYAEPREGWLGETSDDARIREAQLAASGLLANLPRGIATATLAVAFRGPRRSPDGAALLMRDEQHHLLSDPFCVPPGRPPQEVVPLMDRLARLHARFWDDSQLRNPALGLMSPERALRVTGPVGVAARLAAGDTLPYLTVAAESWLTFFEVSGERATARLQAMMNDPTWVLRALERLPRTLVHGDVWGPNLGWLPADRSGQQRLLLLDWALALAGPATYDPLWLCSTWLTADPTPLMAIYRARLTEALRMRGILLDGATWLALADVGYLRTVLTCGEAMARMALASPIGAARQMALARLRWWIERALRAADRLERFT